MPSSVLDRPFDSKYLAATEQVTTARGTLHTVTINRGDPQAMANITLYDSADGDDADHIVAVIIMDTSVFVVPVTLVYDVELENGLYVEFSAGFTVGNITVSYR
jgi:hypothetical protein